MLQAFRLQSEIADSYGSKIYAEFHSRIAADLSEEGPVASLVQDWEGHPILDALPLRLLGAVHELVLTGEASALSDFYPSVGGVFDPEPAWAAFQGVLEAHASWIRSRLDDQVQTNEVRRSAVLAGGFLEIVKNSPGSPLALHEIGASAGLNLFWDRYRYEFGDHRWGDPESPLLLTTEWEGPPPALESVVAVAERDGCDLSPIDIRDGAARTRLQSFVWPDQSERLERLRAALLVASADPPALLAQSADDWLQARLGESMPGHVCVVFQSIMWMYVSKAVRAKITTLIHEAGARATENAPMAWLRLEGSGVKEAELHLQLWPGDEDRLLARAHYHGDWVRWLDGEEEVAGRV